MDEKIQKVLDNMINPALAMHGGGCELLGVSDDGVVTLRLKGACAGCPGARMTLGSFVERVLKEQVPGVTSVQAEFE